MSVVGVDLGGTKILARLIDPITGRARGRVKARTPKTNPADILGAVVTTVQSLEGWEEAEAIGLGMPGLVSGAGLVGPCPNLSGWSEAHAVAEVLTRELGRPVTVGNDVNCAALAEHRFGAAVGVRDMLAVFVGTGVGGGLILDNRLIVGPRGMAAEIGHLTVHPGGRICGCGGVGHLEAYAGRAGIEAEARRRASAGEKNLLAHYADIGAMKSRHVERALSENDPVAVELLAEAADALAVAIGNVVTMLDVGHVVLGGGVVDKLGQPFIEQIEQSAAFGGFGPQVCKLVLGARLDDAGALGAALFSAAASNGGRV